MFSCKPERAGGIEHEQHSLVGKVEGFSRAGERGFFLLLLAFGDGLAQLTGMFAIKSVVDCLGQ